MKSNWPKAIGITAATLAANVCGAAMAISAHSLWPMVVVLIVCAGMLGHSTMGNAISEWRISRLERLAKERK